MAVKANMKKNQFKMYKFHPKCRDTIKENWMNDIHSRVLDVKGFLMKPVAIGDLAEMVRKVLDEVKVPNK